ncbi:SirB2 family protein [Neisseriaceae bacterium ESL0693]|nr:SirB2 family protein [Neisseriaceae bacterium ESL0693]
METLIHFYSPIKMAHILLVVITFLLFNIRFCQRLLWPQRSLNRFLRIAPHINDTFLLLTGVILAWIGYDIPFVNAPWLGVKLILLVGYIVLGVFTIKMQPRTLPNTVSYGLAMLCFFGMIWLVMIRPPLWQ